MFDAFQMADIRNAPAPKPVGTSGNGEDATEPEDDEYQSDSDDDEMEGDVVRDEQLPLHLRVWMHANLPQNIATRPTLFVCLDFLVIPSSRA